jgi:hypothetical protein
MTEGVGRARRGRSQLSPRPGAVGYCATLAGFS